MASAASDADVIRMVREYADAIEADGRAHAPQWMREAAARLERTIAAERRVAELEAALTKADAVADWQRLRIAELEAALLPFAEAWDFVQMDRMSQFMRDQYIASMTVAGTFDADDLKRAHDLVRNPK